MPKKVKWFERSMLNKFLKNKKQVIYLHSVHPLSPEGLRLLPNFQKGGLTGSEFLEGGCWKRGGDFFEQGEGGIAVVT